MITVLLKNKNVLIYFEKWSGLQWIGMNRKCFRNYYDASEIVFHRGQDAPRPISKGNNYKSHVDSAFIPDANLTSLYIIVLLSIMSIIYFTELQLYCLSTLSTETSSIRQQSTHPGRLDGMVSMSIIVRFYFYCPGGLRPFHSSGNLSSIFALLYVALFVM